MQKAKKIDAGLVRAMYIERKMSMSDIAKKLGVTLNAIVYCMRKNNIERRTLTQSQTILFDNKQPSFKERTKLSRKQQDLKLAGLLLYWCEGYKSSKCVGIDFANSDPVMIKLFCKFMRIIYRVNEKRFRVLLYCYANQDIESLMSFWSKVTGISTELFSKPYVRTDFREGGRKMPYGMVHIRYSDKKLFLSIMDSIRCLKI